MWWNPDKLDKKWSTQERERTRNKGQGPTSRQANSPKEAGDPEERKPLKTQPYTSYMKRVNLYYNHLDRSIIWANRYHALALTRDPLSNTMSAHCTQRQNKPNYVMIVNLSHKRGVSKFTACWNRLCHWQLGFGAPFCNPVGCECRARRNNATRLMIVRLL
jgi:hypothetical protein